jgi:hypothetical protein
MFEWGQILFLAKRKKQDLTPYFHIFSLIRTGRVPVLEDNGFAIGDSLATVESLAENFPRLPLRSVDVRARSAVCARKCIPGSLPCPPLCDEYRGLASRSWRASSARASTRADVDRIVAIWTDRLDEHDGPLMFGAFGVADAYSPRWSCASSPMTLSATAGSCAHGADSGAGRGAGWV